MDMAIKGHHFSILASMLAALGAGVFYFGFPGWTPAEERHMMSSFAVMYVLLTYLFLQLVAHIFYGPALRSQMLVDLLSSLLPVIVILYVLVETSRGYLTISTFQLNAALLTAYAMTLDLLVDIGLVLWPRQAGQPR